MKKETINLHQLRDLNTKEKNSFGNQNFSKEVSMSQSPLNFFYSLLEKEKKLGEEKKEEREELVIDKLDKLDKLSESNANSLVVDTLKVYLNRLSKLPLLTEKEEKETAELVKKGDLEAKKKLVERNLRLVVSIAKKYIGKGIPFLDLIQEGNLGLIRGAEKFDPARGFRFSTYSSWWVRQAITRALSEKARMIRLPVHLVEQINKISRLSSEISQEKEISSKELSKLLGIKESQLDLLEEYKLRTSLFSLDLNISEEDDGNGTSLHALIQDEKSVKSDYQLTRENLSGKLSKILNEQLTPEEKSILELHFGLGLRKTHTLREVSEILNIPYEQVRRIAASSFKRLRKSVDLLKPMLESFEIADS